MLSAKLVEAAVAHHAESPSRPLHPDSPSFHGVPGLCNFREVGSWPVFIAPGTSPRHVRRGILLHGSGTNRITAEGEEKLRQLGIKTDFELRSKQQIKKTGGCKEILGIEREWTPVFAAE